MKTVEIARVVLELETPLAIGSGAQDDLLDAPVVLDADGLPALPGSSLAGALRARARLEGLDRWFGEGGKEKSVASSVWVSWGRPHDKSDRPVAPHSLNPGAALPQDEVLDFLRAQVLRDRVRLNEFGVVDGHGKFDKSLVPAGARFTVELRLDDHEVGDMEQLLALLPGLPLGSTSRSGFGRVKVVRAARRRFDLAREFDEYTKVPRALWEKSPLPQVARPTQGEARARRFEVRLQGEGALLIGGRPEGGSGEKKQPDIVPFQERAVVWTGAAGHEQGRVQSRYVLPGTALRGALRHRTAYHLDVMARDQRTQALEALFGTAPKGHGEQALAAGRVRVPELVLPDAKILSQMHVALDRFTQGPRDGMLFEEEALWMRGKELSFTLEVENDPTNEDLKRGVAAMLRALTDLCEGTLGLGHAQSRGFGFFSGSFQEVK